jgi:Raf kinase inhibitor-like YbhB/YbcL family protein
MPHRPLVALALLLGAACGEDAREAEPPEDPGAIELTSSALVEGDTVPVEFTCDGEDVSPPLEWSGVPEGTESLRLVVEDLDAPGGIFVHWAVFGVDASVTGVGRGEVPSGGAERPNHFGVESYRGPCPPEGDDPHRYRFTLRGFDAAGNRLATGTLTVRYGR